MIASSRFVAFAWTLAPLALGCSSTTTSGTDASTVVDVVVDAPAGDVAADAAPSTDAQSGDVTDSSVCPSMGATGNDIVVTDLGALRGVVDGAVRSFKGVPYAAPPTGARRWMPPAPAACYGAVRDATTFGSACAQLDTAGAVTGNEDCLTLNVWAPVERPATPLPVLFFVHGGGNFQGSSGELTAAGVRIYDGAWLAAHGPAVVVTVNYRLGAFGFLAHAALSAEDPNHASGNYGLLDQIAALQWVQRNAAAFGGDPSKVLLFGESAGGVNTCALVTSPRTAGLFSRALIESGACGGAPLAMAESGGAMLTANSSCASSTDTLACLRGLSTDVVLRALPGTTGLAMGSTGYRYQPVIDGWLLPEAPLDAVAAGHQQHVPLIVGTNRDEYAYFFPPTMGRAAMTDAQYRALVMTTFPAGYMAALALYPSAMFPSPYFAFVDMISDATFTCPARTIARAFAGAMTQPVRRYFFTRGLTGAAAAYGAAHAFELPYVFHNLGSGATADQEQLAATMGGYWTRFAATGDPNGGAAPAWPAYDVATDPYVQFGTEVTTAQGLLTGRCNVWDLATMR